MGQAGPPLAASLWPHSLVSPPLSDWTRKTPEIVLRGAGDGLQTTEECCSAYLTIKKKSSRFS